MDLSECTDATPSYQCKSISNIFQETRIRKHVSLKLSFLSGPLPFFTKHTVETCISNEYFRS